MSDIDRISEGTSAFCINLNNNSRMVKMSQDKVVSLNRQDKVVTSLRLPAGLHRRIKSEAAATRTTIGDIVERSFNAVYGGSDITDSQRLDWLIDPDSKASISLPLSAVVKYPNNLRAAIDEAMRHQYPNAGDLNATQGDKSK